MSDSKVITYCYECGSSRIEFCKNGTADNHYFCRECDQEYFEDVKYIHATIKAFKTLQAENARLVKYATALIEDIYTPSRLGLAGEVNPDWKALNELKQCLDELKEGDR